MENRAPPWGPITGWLRAHAAIYVDPLEGDRTMGKLIDAVVIYLPRYLADFGSLFLGPKRFIAQKNTRAKDTFGESLVFLVVSQFLTVVMTAPLARPGISLSVRLMASAVVALLGTALSAIALRFAWRLVGGRATVRSFFVTYAYFASVIAVVLTLFLLLGEGVFKVLAPEIYALVIYATVNGRPIPQEAFKDQIIVVAIVSIYVVGFLFVTVWSLVAWGAYRELNALGRVRSLLALMITGVFGWGIAAIAFFVQSAMLLQPGG